MGGDDVCPLCGCQDSWRHALVSCNLSRCVRALSDEALVSQFTENTEPNVWLWLFKLSDSFSQAQFARLAVTLWAIWYARRKAVYESIFQSPQQTSNFVDNYLAELGHVEARLPQSSADAAAPQVQRWLPPPAGKVKINVDGVVARSHRGGVVAAVCRDHDGHYLDSSAIVFPFTNDPHILEI
ncbi:hypothetical protein ZWY2020_020663 [Hordeum vulgare]|nr:hypothetical protein ZWY2020_020663 [Hordeum vulgare]